MNDLRCVSVVLAALIATAACQDSDEGPTGAGRTNLAPPKPTFDHAPPYFDAELAANNWVIYGDPIRILFGNYLGLPMIAGGSLAYGTSPQTTFLLDTYLDEYFSGEGLPVRVSSPGPDSDRHTLSVAMETDLPLGNRTHLGLLTVRETFSFHDPGNDDFVIVKYTLTNPTPNPIVGLYVAQIIDFDILAPDPNTNGFDIAQSLAWASSPFVTLMGGQAVVGEPTTNFASFSCCDGGPGSQSRAHDFAAWFTLLSGGVANPAPATRTDARNFVGIGPETIGPGEARTFVVALVAGNGMTGMLSNAAAARLRYQALPEPARAPRPALLADVKVQPDVVSEHSEREILIKLSFPKPLPRVKVEGPLDPADNREDALDWLSCDGATPTRVIRDDAHRVSAMFSSHAIARAARPGSASGTVTCAGAFHDGTIFIGKGGVHVRTVIVPVTRLTFHPALDQAPTWSPDGESIAFSSNRTGAFALWRMNVAAGETSAQQITDASGDRTPDWFGNTIVFVRPAGIFVVSDAAVAGVPTPTQLGTAEFAIYPKYSPDGSRIAFGWHNVIWITPAATFNPGVVTDAAILFELHPEWSPDGGEIFFTGLDAATAGFGIFKVSAEGGSAVRATPRELGPVDNLHPAASPDGRTVAFLSFNAFTPEFVLQDRGSGEHTPLTFDPALVPRGALNATGLAQNLEFSPDGTKLLFQVDGDIYVADLSRKRVR